MVQKGFLGKCVLVKGRGWLGRVGDLFQEHGQHSSAEMGRPRGLMAGKVALSRCTPDSFVIVGK